MTHNHAKYATILPSFPLPPHQSSLLWDPFSMPGGHPHKYNCHLMATPIKLFCRHCSVIRHFVTQRYCTINLLEADCYPQGHRMWLGLGVCWGSAWLWQAPWWLPTCLCAILFGKKLKLTANERWVYHCWAQNRVWTAPVYTPECERDSVFYFEEAGWWLPG